jgi:hypothetical protein
MAKIHLIDGEKGGVGKSLFCRVLVEYFQQQAIKFSLIDADRTNPDVGLIYEPKIYGARVTNSEKEQVLLAPENVKKGRNKSKSEASENYGNEGQIFTGDEVKTIKSTVKDDSFQPIFFSEDERKSYTTDFIFEKAIQQDVIVNLPAQVAPLVNSWIEKNSLLSLGKELGVSFSKWFICTGGYDSISLFKESLNYYQDRITHILVRNGGLCDSWSHLAEDNDLMTAIAKYGVKVIDFPKLSYRERNLIDANKWTFSQSLNQSELGVIGKQRIKLFLQGGYEEINRVISNE